MKIAHILNPVKVDKNNELYFAQKFTFISIQKAVECFNKKDVELINCETSFQEDEGISPTFFNQLTNLNRAVSDVNSSLSTSRKLPLIKDVLDKTKEIDDLDYLIYSNVDIGLMPYFYNHVVELIEEGYDAICVNRRRVNKKYLQSESISQIYADQGKSHPGFDCFVIKKELLNQFVLGDICIGVPFLGVTLLHNIASFAQKPTYLTGKHLTFHLGMNVLGFDKSEYYKHNRTEFFKKIKPALAGNYQLAKFPYSSLPIYKRALKWLLNPSLFTIDYLELEKKSFLEKTKLKVDELRWRLLSR